MPAPKPTAAAGSVRPATPDHRTTRRDVRSHPLRPATHRPWFVTGPFVTGPFVTGPFVTGLAAACAGVVLAAPADATTSEPRASPVTMPAAALAVVDMEMTVLAAQIDPRRADHTLTPGAEASVLAVEQALQARNLLDLRWVDGYFGTQTITAYVAYQRSLGYTGLAANGMPGATSLAKLGTNHFRVARTFSPGSRVSRNGHVVDARTQAMLAEAERLLGFRLVVEQGSYNPGGDATSAGTHDGGGVVDLRVTGMTAQTRTSVVRALRTVGFAAWLRSPSQGAWPWHLHAAAISDTDLSSQAQHQTGDYCLGLNGLANRGPDDGPRVPIRTWEEYQRLN
jgi:peptidoglycan hydrolase-like protein with peptidoglycan-binding domain